MCTFILATASTFLIDKMEFPESWGKDFRKDTDAIWWSESERKKISI